MPFIRYATKAAARRAQGRFVGGAALFQIIGIVFGAVGGMGFGPAECEAVSIGLGYLGSEANSAANDPPRRDYRTSTGWRRRTMPRYDLETRGGAFADAASEGAALLSAMVRAVERSQQADLVNETSVAAARVEEADHYAARCSVVLGRAHAYGDDLASSMERKSPKGRSGVDRRPDRFGRSLGPAYPLPSEGIARELLRASPLHHVLVEVDADEDELAMDAVRLIRRYPETAGAVVLRRFVLPSMSDLAQSLLEWGPTAELTSAPPPRKGFD